MMTSAVYPRVTVFVCSLFLLAVLVLNAGSDADIGRDNTNAFLLSNQGELFYPQGANVGYLLKKSVSPRALDSTLAMLAEAGVNTLRVNLQDALDDGAPLSEMLTRNGLFQDEVIKRFDALLTAAKKHNQYVAPILFDLQSMQQQWDASPFNSANGGPCGAIRGFFAKPMVRLQSLNRAAQIIERFQGRNILAWELARGANIWDADIRPDAQLQRDVMLWMNLLLDRVVQVNRDQHLTAVSFYPNTLPYELMEFFDVLFVHFRSKAPVLAADSMDNFLQECRKSRRPVFISEAVWNAKPAKRDLFVHTVYWSSLTLNSGVFLSPLERDGQYDFSSFDLLLAKARQAFMPFLDFTGPARPPSRAPVQVMPQDQYIHIENIVGADRLFWLFTRQPGESKAQLNLQTIEGVYDLQWFDIENLEPYERKRFTLLRRELAIETPPFEQSIFGVLRLIKKGEVKTKNEPPAPNQSGASAPSLREN